MRLLLDTHIALWAVMGSERLPSPARDLLLNPDHDLWVSVVSVWEVAIKHRLRRESSRYAVISGRGALALFKQTGFAILPVLEDHCAAVDDLPGHHADPFDRLLVAQALAEPMRLITADKALAAYGDHVLLV